MKRVPFFALLCFIAFYVSGIPRTTSAEFSWDTVLIQSILSALVLIVPCSLLASRARGRLTLCVSLILFGIVSSNVFAALNEAEIRSKWGDHPSEDIVTARWSPFSKCTVSYEPTFKKWIGED